MTPSDERLRRAFADVNLPDTQRPSPDEIRALVEGEGDEAARLATLASLVSTPEGRRELNVVRALHDGFWAEEDGTRGRTGARRPTAWMVWGSLAAALVLVTVGLLQHGVTRLDATVYRSVPGGLALVSPADGAQFNGRHVFVWRGIAGASYEFELFTADGTPVAREVTADTVLALRAVPPAGDYRWWVTARLDDGTQVRSGTRRLLAR